MNATRIQLQLTGAELLTPENTHRITARATVATDLYGNRLVSGKSPVGAPAPYFCQWTIKREAGGFCFSEMRTGFGICGTHPTVHDLVMSTVILGCGIVVEVQK